MGWIFTQAKQSQSEEDKDVILSAEEVMQMAALQVRYSYSCQNSVKACKKLSCGGQRYYLGHSMLVHIAAQDRQVLLSI